MAQKLDQKEITTFDELFWANTYQIDAVTQLLIEKGFFTEQEFFTKLKLVQGEWERKRGTPLA